MSQPCGCCAGIQIITPQTEANPPGMSALKYRVGTYATFYESMLARLSTLTLNIPSMDGSAATQISPLKQLTTREPSDPSIALLDAWAVVADVLTFYQERIANEGYLATATEHRSMLELARLVNYTLRPGVSASVYLAFTVQTGFSGTIPAGTRAQSMPGSGQMPQFFETSADLAVSDAWNDLQPRLTRPQNITAPDLIGAEAGSLHALIFQGLTTNLKIGDGIIIVAGTTAALRLVDSITPQPATQSTQVCLRAVAEGSVLPMAALAQRYIGEASGLFQGSGIATQAAQQLSSLIQQSQPAAAVVRNVQQLQAVAAKRKLTRLGAWLSDLSDDLNASVKASPSAVAALDDGSLSALGQIDKIIGELASPPSLQPASTVALKRTVGQVFGAASDMAPRLLAAFYPAAASTLYQAWDGIETAKSATVVCAARVKAGIFANNFAGLATVTQIDAQTGDTTVGGTTTGGTTIGGTTTGSVTTGGVTTGGTTTGGTTLVSTTNNTTFTLPTLGDAVRDLITVNSAGMPALSGLPLDAVYDQITVGSVVAITRATLDGNGNPTGQTTTTYHNVQSVQTVSRETATAGTATNANSQPVPTGYTAKVTQLSLSPQWLTDLTAGSDVTNALNSTLLLRSTVIYAQAEALPLAEEPLDSDVQGSTIELDGLYHGLESGRWIIVSGNRADIAGTTSATASELVMIAGVSQVTPKSPSDIVHTSLTLANNLAYTYDLSSVTIYGNVTEATNGQSVGEVLGNGATSQAFQTFTLKQQPVTYLSAATPAGAQDTLTVTVNEIEWQETDDLSALGPNDHGYTTLTNDSDQTSVIFGNGTHGARVPTGTANVKALYRYGIGSAGNVDARQISQLATQPLGVQSVINPLPASGGADPDTPSQARVNTPLAVKALDRLVSVQDYADFSRSYAGIGKAASVKLSNGRRQVVYVTIAGAEDIPILLTSDLYRNLVAALQQFGDPYQPVLVGVRKVKLLAIFAGIEVLPDYQFEDVEPNVRAALLDTFSFDQRDLAQTAFLSEAISAMQGVQGVAFVNVTIFDSVSEDATASQLAALSATLILRGHVSAKPARVDSSLDLSTITNPTAQDYFQIEPAELVYLTPNIPDTLILTEITSTNPGPPPSLRGQRLRTRLIRKGGAR